MYNDNDITDMFENIEDFDINKAFDIAAMNIEGSNEVELMQTETFLQLYKCLELAGRKIYFPSAKENESIIGRLINSTQLKKYKDDLDYCRVVRNFLTHNPKVGGVYPIVPSTEMLRLLQHCVKIVLNPTKAIEKAIPANRIETASLDDNLLTIMSIMHYNNYTHIPIVDDNNKLFGIFSDNALSAYVNDNEGIVIDKDTKIGFLKDYLASDKHSKEYFLFVPKDILLVEVEDLFNKNEGTRPQKLLAAVFITQNGRAGEKVLGMITPWDILRLNS